jgi:hypothetical protein
LALTLLLVTAAWTACDKGGSEAGSGAGGEGEEQEATTPSEGEGGTETATSEAEGGEGESPAGQAMPSPEEVAEAVAQGPAMVDVSAEGTQFDPPVTPEQIPPGAWYCPMDTVHYASLQQGDGSCPVCGMTLLQRGAGEGHMMPGHEMPAHGTGEGHMMPGHGNE